MSTFGTLFRVTTYGESHCASVGCIVDGCPPVRSVSLWAAYSDPVLGWRAAWAHTLFFFPRLTLRRRAQGMELTSSDLQTQLTRRRPGQSALTTPVSPV